MSGVAKRKTRYGVAWSNNRCHSTDKVRFRSEEAALHQLGRIIQLAVTGERVPDKLEIGVYLHDECGGWHLTSQPRGQQMVSA